MANHRSAPWILLFAAAVWIAACKSAPVDPGRNAAGPAQPSMDELGDLEATRLDMMESAARRGQHARVIEIAGVFLKESPASRAAARVLLLKGRAEYNSGELEAARSSMENIALQHPTSPQALEAKAWLGIIAYKQGRHRDAVETLEPIHRQMTAAAWKEQVAAALSASYFALGDDAKGAQWAAKGPRNNGAPADDPDPGAPPANLIESAGAPAHGGSGVESLEKQCAALERGSQAAEPVCFRLALTYLHIRQTAKGVTALKEHLAAYPNGRTAARAKELLQAIEARTAADPNVIGVILPLSGKYRGIGVPAYQGLRMGLGKTEPWTPPAPAKDEEGKTLPPPPLDEEIQVGGTRIIVRDDEGDPGKAKRLVRELVIQHKVMAIIGPLTAAASEAAAYEAEDLEVPIVLLSRKEGLPEIGPWVFRNAITYRAQAHFIAGWAINRMGYKRFGIIHPATPGGTEIANAFWDTVESLGGEVTGIESYPADATTFKDAARKLVGRYYLELRKEFFDPVKRKELEGLKGWVRNRKLEELQASVPPVVDFDAVFIPDYYQPVAGIAPALAVEDVILYTSSDYHQKRIMDATGLKDLKLVRLLGIDSWNHPKLIDLGEKYVEESVFVDGWNPRSGWPETKGFVSVWRSAYNGEPNLYAAQGFDTMAMVSQAVSMRQPSSRLEARKLLAAIRDFPGALGKTSFGPEGEAEHPLTLFTVYKKAIITMDDYERQRGIKKAPAAPAPKQP
ncbi:MAG: hypothetical protein GMKNLPBB_01051 [Myxococcota bacterium]|nr:hypothetical protein [Myxococcota bacterium]